MDKLDSVKVIIESQKFNSYTKIQQQEILDQIIATGEVSRDDVMKIYNESNINIPYLENLPYNVFLNVIINGEIKERDLINLCDSSPFINRQCNKAFKIENTGETIPQYLFVLLLQKLGIDYYKINQKRPNLSPKDVYFYCTVGEGANFLRLKEKINYIANNSGEGWFKVKYLFELLYDEEKGKPAFFRYFLRGIQSIDLNKYLYVGRSIYIIQEPLDNEMSINIEDVAKDLGITTEQFLNLAYQKEATMPVRIRLFHRLFPGMKFNFENYVKIIRNFSEYYRQHLLAMPEISDHDVLFQYLKRILTEFNASMMRNKNFDGVMLLDDQDIEYLIRLHLMILSGELTIATKFRIEDLI